MSNSHFKFDKALFRDLWHLLKPYWTSEEKWSAWFLLFLNILCVIGEVLGNVGFNHFHKIFFNALQSFDKKAIISSLEYLVVVVSFLALMTCSALYVNGLLSIRWRRWLTKNYLQKWLHNHNHYRMQILDKNIDNPDQRISEDLEKFPTTTLTLFFGPYKFLHSLLMIFSFGYILWGLSTSFVFHFGSSSFTIPGYLCWIGLIYAAIGTWITGWLGKKLAFLNYQQQRYNADFRFSLVRLREASEQVSFYRGEMHETHKFHGLFSRVFNNFINIISLKTRLSFFTQSYNFMSYAVGLVVSMPFYLAKAFQLGTVMQISSAYSSVVSGFSAFMDSFNDLADWRSVIHRLSEFCYSVENLNKMAESKIAIEKRPEKNIVVENLTLELPSGDLLFQKMNLVMNAGECVLLSGPSGIGKSTFLRALAGLWSHGEGKISLPHDAKILFLPQKIYMPLGSLKEVLFYPQVVNADDEMLEEVLKVCGLEKFKFELNSVKNWSQELSLGEQQLIGFARIFLYQPDVIFLDEATSALDEKTEKQIYLILKRILPAAIIVSVGHRNSLRQFHEKEISLAGEVGENFESDILSGSLVD